MRMGPFVDGFRISDFVSTWQPRQGAGFCWVELSPSLGTEPHQEVLCAINSPCEDRHRDSPTDSAFSTRCTWLNWCQYDEMNQMMTMSLKSSKHLDLMLTTTHQGVHRLQLM